MIEPEVTRFHLEGHVAWITLNLPEAMNSLNPQLRWELSQHVDEVERNDDIRMAVVTGAGARAFDFLPAKALYTEYDAERRRRLSEDVIEGPLAFAEKRSPNRQGR